jgi:hypothetical protein
MLFGCVIATAGAAADWRAACGGGVVEAEAVLAPSRWLACLLGGRELGSKDEVVIDSMIGRIGRGKDNADGCVSLCVGSAHVVHGDEVGAGETICVSQWRATS